MNDWQQQFADKLELVRDTSRTQFEELCSDVIGPIFEEFRGFTSAQGFCATAPVSKPGIRTFRFAVTEGAYVLLTFKLAGFEHCEFQADVFVPGNEKHACTPVHVELTSLDVGWARRMFEQTLDQFLDRFVEALSERGESLAEAIGQ